MLFSGMVVISTDLQCFYYISAAIWYCRGRRLFPETVFESGFNAVTQAAPAKLLLLVGVIQQQAIGRWGVNVTRRPNRVGGFQGVFLIFEGKKTPYWTEKKDRTRKKEVVSVSL